MPAKLFIGQCRNKAKIRDERIKILVAIEAQLETARRKCKAILNAARGDQGNMLKTCTDVEALRKGHALPLDLLQLALANKVQLFDSRRPCRFSGIQKG